MIDVPHITTGGTAYNRTLGRIGLAAAVLLATVLVGAGSAVAAPAGPAPAMDAPNETAADSPVIDPSAAPSVSRTAPVTLPGDFESGSVTAASDEGLQMEVVEVTEERIVVNVFVGSDSAMDGIGQPAYVFLGHAERFVIHEDEDATVPGGAGPNYVVSLPEDTDGFATPVEVERLDEETYRMSFRTEDVATSNVADFVGSDYIELGLAVPADGERTIPGPNWDTDEVGASQGWW